jgi:hypothetical protein
MNWNDLRIALLALGPLMAISAYAELPCRIGIREPVSDLPNHQVLFRARRSAQ